MSHSFSTKSALTGLLCLVVGFHVTIAAERVTDPKTRIDQKVIVTGGGGVDLFDAPSGTKLSKLPEMQIRFVMRTGDMEDDAESNGEKWFRVSVNGEDPVGWVPASGVTLWKTRSALIPTTVPGREFIVKDSDGKPLVTYKGGTRHNYQLFAGILEPRASADDPYSVFVFGGTLQGVVFGTAHERNKDGQIVAIGVWFLRYVEVQRLKSRLLSIIGELETLSATERKNNTALFTALQLAFTEAGAGQRVSTTKARLSQIVNGLPPTTLAELVKGLPLRNDVLNMTIDDIARLDDTAYKQWLDRLRLSEKRCEEILNIAPGGSGLNEWLLVGDNAGGAPTPDRLVTFMPVDQLP